MRRVSRKTAKRAAECRDFRRELVLSVGVCEVCGHDPMSPRIPRGGIQWALCCHEIANGPHRQKALDKPFAVLCVCWLCNSEELTDKKKWPAARQLCLLKKRRPDDYDLEAYLNEFHPRAPFAITEADVDRWENTIP